MSILNLLKWPIAFWYYKYAKRFGSTRSISKYFFLIGDDCSSLGPCLRLDLDPSSAAAGEQWDQQPPHDNLAEGHPGKRFGLSQPLIIVTIRSTPNYTECPILRITLVYYAKSIMLWIISLVAESSKSSTNLSWPNLTCISWNAPSVKFTKWSIQCNLATTSFLFSSWSPEAENAHLPCNGKYHSLHYRPPDRPVRIEQLCFTTTINRFTCCIDFKPVTKEVTSTLLLPLTKYLGVCYLHFKFNWLWGYWIPLLLGHARVP